MRKTLMIILILTILAGGVASQVAFAVLPPTSIIVTGARDDNGDCGATELHHISEVGTAIYADVTIEGVVNEGAGHDVFTVGIFDANGVFLGTSVRPGTYSVGVGVVGQIPVQVHIHEPFGGAAPTARPWTISVHDILAGEHMDVAAQTNPALGSLTFDPASLLPACGALPLIDSAPSLNEGLGDLEAQLFNVEDDNGDPALNFYEINDAGAGKLSLSLTEDDLAPFAGNPPMVNTLLMASDSGKLAVYILTTGEIQVNIGPDEGGNVWVVIFTGLPPTELYSYSFNVFDILEP